MKPYVYIIQNKEQTHWYVGMRSANECPANADTGYWGSSDYLDELIAQTGKENWTKTIISEFDDKDIAHEFEQMLIELMWDLPGRVNKAMGGYCDLSDPEVKAKHQAASSAANKKKAQDPVWQSNTRAGAKKRSEDPVYRANHKAAMEEVWEDPVYKAKREAMHQDPVYRANHKAAMVAMHQDPVYRAKREAMHQDPEYRTNVNAANQKSGPKRRKPFIATSIATGEEYFCESGVCEQAKALCLNPGAVSKFLRGTYSSTNYKGFTFRYV